MASTYLSNSLATADAKSGIDVQLISRGNEVLATRKTDASGHLLFESGLAKGEGGMRRPRCWSNGRQRRGLRFSQPNLDCFRLTDRGVSGRPAPKKLDAFVYAERGVYRSGESAYVTGLCVTRKAWPRLMCR